MYETVTTPEKRKVTVNTIVPKEEAYTYTEYQTVTTPEKRTVTSTICVPVQVTQTVPVTRTVVVPVNPCPEMAPAYVAAGGCGGCAPPPKHCCFSRHGGRSGGCGGMTGGFAASSQCQTVTEMVAVTRTVMPPQTKTTEVTVNVCKVVSVEKKGTRTVQTVVPTEQELTVYVCQTVTVRRRSRGPCNLWCQPSTK